MISGRLLDHSTGEVLTARVLRTTNPWDRLRGLLGRAPLEADQGLLLMPCGSVHTLMMAYAIDLVYLQRDWTVARVVSAVAPWRFSAGAAYMTLELPVGAAAAYRRGQRLRWQQQ